jgi:glycerol-3-phosphate dehydrogenase (NAD(P)+)
MKRVAVAGAGAWGTALANVMAAAGHPVTLWTRDAAQAAALAGTRASPHYLPGIRLHAGIRPTAALADLAEAEAVLLVTPAQSTRTMADALARVLPQTTPLVLCAKGLEQGSNRFLSDVVREVRGDAPLAMLSGPSFAQDVAQGLPTAVTLACPDGTLARTLAETVSGLTLRVYHGTDLRGVEIGGAAKNVLAIACGAVVGRGLGESAKAALMARGFAELLRFAEKHGAERETLMGLSGLGDLVLTASSAQSRNFAFGERLGRGAPVAEAAGGKLAEGALTAPVLVAMAQARGIDMPIASAVAAVIAGRLTLPQAIDALMQRPLKREH